MKSLRDQIREAAAELAQYNGADGNFANGMAFAEARLLPLLDKLADVVEAADKIADSNGEDIRRYDLWEALARLKEALKAKKQS